MIHNFFEISYVVPPETPTLVRDLARGHLALDDYCAANPNHAYAVQDIYLDDWNFGLYRTMRPADRCKNPCVLRVRSVSTDSASPVYFEIRREMNHQSVILRQSVAVKADFASSLLAGAPPVQTCLLEPSPRALQSVQRFCQLVDQNRAKPRVAVSYQREAWTCNDNAVRLTFDREIWAAGMKGHDIDIASKSLLSCYSGRVVLALKFSQRFPEWIRKFVGTLKEMRCESCKYVEAVEHLGMVN